MEAGRGSDCVKGAVLHQFSVEAAVASMPDLNARDMWKKKCGWQEDGQGRQAVALGGSARMGAALVLRPARSCNGALCSGRG